MKLIRCDECGNEIEEMRYTIRCEQNDQVLVYGDWTELHFCSDGCAADWFGRSHEKRVAAIEKARLA